MLMEQKLKLMAGKQFKFFSKERMKKVGLVAFLFFLIKGILWLVLGGSLISFLFVDL